MQETELAVKRYRLEAAEERIDWPKRLFDVVAALIGLALLSPFFLITAIAIKLEDPRGPVFFSQTRIGKYGRTFKMHKFRSMVVDAEQQFHRLAGLSEVSGAMFKMKDDPRVTKVGKFIRRTSIDELPQFWNVLKGDMSIVGPRPPLPREVAAYREYDFQRLTVVPGCTGLWQVSGRSSVGFEEMVELDLQYIRKRSFWFDLVIIARTVRLLFGSRNAF
ncbi:exopolysaccharide biosynthesis polyprenyl glycosylphosphotransferase [Cohnella sp. CFH 77786]|nr:sugar transferase [Cohnella sp. CFH 77786]MBW5448368.1 exopolysaccharide biosynthesis polyprenyl glycosylphosphotransferase [Cohnella sp. CFH 77786]